MMTKLIVHPDIKANGEKVRCELYHSSYNGIVFHFIDNARYHIDSTDLFQIQITGLRLPTDRRKEFNNGIKLDLKSRTNRLKITEIDGVKV